MSLNKYFQKRFALSAEGATSFISGSSLIYATKHRADVAGPVHVYFPDGVLSS